ncbi:MAG TPA: tautomerase family protein [Mycobacterium sp.]|jgi:4-oxalocrotonate tautomerase|nr:tautomerase family protein [Mycobacterium sp.]
MPLVRIDLPNSIESERHGLIGDIVYQAMVDVLNVPDGDKFQIITAHDADSLRIDPAYLGIDRAANAFIIDITLNAGRAVELKRQFYATAAERLSAEADVRPQDVLIVLTEVAKENWSFGNGEAQYA